MKATGTSFRVEIDGEPIGNITEFELEDNDFVPNVEGTCTVSGTFEMSNYDWLVFRAFIYSFIYDS